MPITSAARLASCESSIVQQPLAPERYFCGLLLLLDAEGIACSTGSACSAGVQRPSHVLIAMGLSEDETTSTLRFSLSHLNTINEIARLGSVIASVVARSKAASGKK